LVSINIPSNPNDTELTLSRAVEPGATEVRALAAYVQALGGWLEIISSVGDERVMLQ
jgi:hypothetical protein